MAPAGLAGASSLSIFPLPQGTSEPRKGADLTEQTPPAAYGSPASPSPLGIRYPTLASVKM